MEAGVLARYPFRPEASEYLKDNGITLKDVIDSSAYAQARSAGSRRVLEALVDGQISDHAFTSDIEVMVELLSYLVARIIVSCVGEDKMLLERYSLAEAKLAQGRLETQDMEFIIETASILGLEVEQISPDKASVHFSDYLINSSQMRSQEWALVNQVMDSGWVELNQRRLARLMQNAISAKIKDELPLPVNDHIIEVFEPSIEAVKAEIEKRKAQYEKESYGKVSFLRLPPCMKKLLEMMKKGQNVPHVGRFALTAFLHTIGMNNDQIVALFSTSPDFREDLARYQVEHITGKSSGIEYLPQECSTMKTQGICYNPDSLCNRDWMGHPLTYYSVKGKKKDKPEKPEKAESD